MRDQKDPSREGRRLPIARGNRKSEIRSRSHDSHIQFALSCLRLGGLAEGSYRRHLPTAGRVRPEFEGKDDTFDELSAGDEDDPSPSLIPHRDYSAVAAVGVGVKALAFSGPQQTLKP